MPRSASLRAADAFAVARLVGECRDLGDDAPAWRAHFFRAVGRLVGAPVVGGGELGGFRTAAYRDLGTVDVGWTSGSTAMAG